MSKETFYFSHDYNTRSDEKIIKLLRKYGMAGYGIFWTIVEMLYNNDNSLKVDYDDLAYELRIDAKIIKSIINDFGLFVMNDGYFGSESIERRLSERDKRSEIARQKAFKRWRKDATASENDATASENDANPMHKGKERKGKDKKRIFIPPTIDEVKIFFAEKGYTEEGAIKAFNHYALANWHDTNGKQVLNWKQKMNTNWFDDKNKISTNEHKPMMP